MKEHLPFPTTLGHTPLALLVDRDADTRRMYAEYLQAVSCDTDEAEDGREALAKAIAHPPDCVVTETRLSGIDGYELCELLRRDDATRRASIVFVTADGFARNIRRAEAAGADSVLVKPCLPERLEAELRRLMRQSRELSERIRAVRERSAVQFTKAEHLMVRSREAIRQRTMLSRAFARRSTQDPPARPPTLVCPGCDQLLTYLVSHIGGVNEQHAEQWDDFECPAACGTFEYRHRTRKLRRF